jgi:hypothetical protein
VNVILLLWFETCNIFDGFVNCLYMLFALRSADHTETSCILIFLGIYFYLNLLASVSFVFFFRPVNYKHSAEAEVSHSVALLPDIL